MTSFSLDECPSLVAYGATPRGDAEISGTGVVLAFLISAYVTFAALCIAYVAGLVDAELLSPVDRRVFHARGFCPSTASTRAFRFHAAIRGLVLMLSDQQIVTGIAIMIAEFHGFWTGAISVYHFQTVLYLAWMSSSVHLSAIVLLGPHFRERRGAMVWRLAGMIVLFVMLVVGLVPTISNDWGIQTWDNMPDGNTGWAIPARCVWGNLWGGAASARTRH